MKLYNIKSLSVGSLDKNTAEGQNGLRALENAMCHYNDGRKVAFSIIEVEGYKCIAHIKCVGTYQEIFDEIIFPFDKERLYPIQGLQLEYTFKRKW